VTSVATNVRIGSGPPPPRAVSVVVPAYNEEHGLRPVLTSLLQTLSALPAVTY
jgi:hypothetical protein